MSRSGVLSRAQMEQLTKIRLFSGMSPETVNEIVKLVGDGVRSFDKGETVVYEGTKAKWVLPVLSGRLSVFESAASGTRNLVRAVEAGHLFGATLVTANLEYYPGMAVATLPSEVMFLEIEKIKSLWQKEKYAKFFANLYSIVSDEVLNCWRKMSILSCKKAEDRFMMYLRWRSAQFGETDLVMPFPNSAACAQFLGISRTGLSLAVKRLVARGEIEHPARGRFVIRVNH